MAFELPRLVDLTYDQNTIMNAPVDKNIIVSGAPGTGKSVLAIYRAADFSKRKRKTLLLVYNKPLMKYIASAIKSLDIQVEVSTYHSWIRKFYKTELGKDVPLLPSFGDWQDLDLDEILADFSRLDYYYDNIIIDEAQDFPLTLISALTQVGKVINCFMDVNQRIVSNRYTSYLDVAKALGIKAMYTLNENFRNTEEIFEFAQIYNRVNNVTTTKNGEKPLFVKVGSEEEAFSVMETLIRNNSSRTIGVFANYTEQEELYNKLKSAFDREIQVNAYVGGSRNRALWNIDFDKSGVYVLSSGTVKGLEFDVVIIPNADRLRAKRDKSLDTNAVYVAATRASEELYCIYSEKVPVKGCIDIFGPLQGNENIVDWE